MKKLIIALSCCLILILFTIAAFVGRRIIVEKNYTKAIEEAERYLEEQNYQCAIEDYNIAININSKQFLAYDELATTYGILAYEEVEKENYSKAIDYFNMSIDTLRIASENVDDFHKNMAETTISHYGECVIKYDNILGSEDSVELPIAYEDILEHCRNIIDKVEVEHAVEKEHSAYYPEQEGELAGFADFLLHSGINKEDFCYSYTDLNDDGIMELILAGRCNDEKGGTINYKAGYTLINIFTLDGDEAVALVGAHFRSSWFINGDLELINECKANPAWYEIGVYSFGENATTLEEKYCFYNKYLENNKDVGQFERVNGGKEVLLEQYDDFNFEDLWEKYMEVLNQYTENLYELDLVSICEE